MLRVRYEAFTAALIREPLETFGVGYTPNKFSLESRRISRRAGAKKKSARAAQQNDQRFGILVKCRLHAMPGLLGAELIL